MPKKSVKSVVSDLQHGGLDIGDGIEKKTTLKKSRRTQKEPRKNRSTTTITTAGDIVIECEERQPKNVTEKIVRTQKEPKNKTVIFPVESAPSEVTTDGSLQNEIVTDTVFRTQKEPHYSCQECGFATTKKSNYNKHLLTMKHRTQNMIKKEYACEICGKSYAARNSLWYHKRTCHQDVVAGQQAAKSADGLAAVVRKQSEVISNLLVSSDKVVKQNGELVECVKGLLSQTGSSGTTVTHINNNFNVNVFLNERCKDAVNITDFVESLKLELHDWDRLQNQTLIEGLGHMIVKELNCMELYQRPIHCTDVKRQTIYVKTNDEWERDNEQRNVRKAIHDIANRQRTANMQRLREWDRINPGWMKSDKKKDEYTRVVSNTMKDFEGKDEKKLVKSIADVVRLDRTQSDVKN